ncbi:MAG: hypothetical protein EAX86_03345 [Candidatus Heimdallarchaeota archaeon]|nr:hypothetical protein [Candidatus Heimdallarchaeota archaeon]
MASRLKENPFWIFLLFLSCLMIINFFLVYISIKSFQGFTVSGRPIFYMVSFAFSTYVCFGIVLLSSILYLWKKSFLFDLLVVAGAQVGVVTGAITILVGMIWSYVEWGYFWQWEPRQTTTLIMWMAYIGLLIFREMLDENYPEKRGTLTSIFGIVSFPSVPLSNYVVGALHPPPQQTTLEEGLGMLLMLNFLLIGAICVLLVYLTYRTNEIDFKLKKIRKIKMEAF